MIAGEFDFLCSDGFQTPYTAENKNQVENTYPLILFLDSAVHFVPSRPRHYGRRPSIRGRKSLKHFQM